MVLVVVVLQNGVLEFFGVVGGFEFFIRTPSLNIEFDTLFVSGRDKRNQGATCGKA